MTLQLSEMFERAPDAQILTTEDGTILRGNRRARELFEADGQAFAGEGLLEFVSQVDVRSLEATLRELSELAEGAVDERALDLKTAEAKIVPVTATVRRLEDPEDGEGRLLWSLRRTRMEQGESSENRVTSARLKALVANAVNAIITIGGEGIVKTYNPAAEEMFGWRAEEVIGNKINMLMPEPYASEHDGYLTRYHRTNEPHIIGIGREVEARHKDGSTFPIDLAVSELKLDDQVLYTGMVRDISERKAAEAERERLIEQLEGKNAELERFTYTVSHDLKSPLITIKGFLGMLERDVKEGNEERVASDLKRIAAAADKMKELLDELLELSRIGRVVNPSEHIDLTELAEQTVELLSGPIDERGVNVEISGQLPTVYGDRTRLQEVFQNLIENAVKFMGDEPDPRVEVGVEERDGRTVCFVRDNGVGVEEKYADKVFGLFEQLDQTHKGSGVGLTLVHRIISVHGGDIWVESAGKGAGSTFYFTLPTEQS